MGSPPRPKRLTSLAPLVILTLSLGAAVFSTSALSATAEVQGNEEPLDFDKIIKLRVARRSGDDGKISTRTQRYMIAVAKAQDEGDSDKGLALLENLDPRRLTARERAQIYIYSGYLHYGKGDLDGTIEAFRKVLAEEIMPLKGDVQIRFNIAQIRASQFRWHDAIEALHEWFRWSEEPDPLAYYLLGIAHYQLEEMELSILNTEKAVDLKDEPPEGWLQLLSALYVQKEDYANATPVLEELVLRFPKKKYWVQLSLIYGALDNYRSALAIQQIAYQQGFFTKDSELRRLVRSYLYKELPYQAAVILEKGLDLKQVEATAENYEMLANSWIASREFDKSLPPLVRAAELLETGRLFVRLGQVNLQGENWQAAVRWLEKAIKKGSLKNPGSAQLLLGIAYYNSLMDDQARRSFERALKHKSSRGDAERWITHMATEAG